MPKETAAAPAPVMPQTAADALKVWDACQPLSAIQVESEGAEQEDIYDAAFFWIRKNNTELENPMLNSFTLRERVAAHSVAFVAMRVGWAQMVLGHRHDSSPLITIQKGD